MRKLFLFGRRSLVGTIARMVLGAVVIFFSFLLTNCAPRQTSFEEAPKRGFVPEVDEPAARGTLSRITPAELDVRWRFSISPDSRTLVFSARREGSQDPYQLHSFLSGSNVVIKLTSGGKENCWDPTYSSNGENVTFRRGNSFWQIQNDGSGVRLKLPGSGLSNDYYPELSAKDNLVFVTYDELNEKTLIWTVDMDGSNLTQFREGDHPVWSPDGNTIAFEYGGDIWLMGNDGTKLTQLTSSEEVREDLPSFSPDGNSLVFVSDEGPDGKAGSDANIWYIKTDGTGKTQVTSLESWDSWPRWSEDGIYFLSGRANEDKDIIRIWRIKL